MLLTAVVGTLSAAAASIALDRILVRPAMPALRPICNDSTDTKGKKFDTKALLAQKADMDFTRGESEVMTMGADSTFTFQRPASGECIYTLQTSLRPEEFFAGKLKVNANVPYSLFVDGKEKASKTSYEDSLTAASAKSVELKIEPQTTTAVTVRLLAADTAAAPKLRLCLVPDKKSENVAVAIDPALKSRFMLAQTDQGEKAMSTSMSADGRYTLVRYFKRLENQKTQWRYEIVDTKTGTVVARPAYISGWMPRANAYYYTRATDDGYDLYKVKMPGGEEEKIAAGIPNNSFFWSPNEDYIVYYATVKEEEDKSPLRRYNSPDDRIKGNRTRSTLKMYNLNSGMEQALTFGTKNTTLQDISADASKILFMVDRETPTKYPFYAFTLVQLDVKSMKADTIINANPYITGASYSPDAKKLMVTGSPRAFGEVGLNAGNHPIPNDFDAQLYIYDIASATAQAPLHDFNPSVVNAVWNNHDGMIYMLVNEGFCKNLYQLNPNNGKIQSLPADAQNISNFSIGDKQSNYISYTGQGDNYAGRAFILTLKGAKNKLIADPYAATLAKIELGATTPWTFTAKDGTLIEGTMTTPPDFDPNKKYPLLVYYYGGTSPSQHGLTHPYVPQLYASRGYVVYVLNPSGTYGYGQEFSARHVNAWGKQTAEDIIEGVKLFCKEHPFVNDKKIGCFGASYGGFMTQYLLTQTDIFAAAMSHAGISNLTSYWGEGYWGYSYNSVAAAESYPWTDPELFTKQGSLFNADKIHTPLLLIHGTVDTNVPIGESIQLFNALSLLGRDVEFISVAGGDHTSGSFSYDKRLLWHRTVMAWFARWLKDDPRWWDEMYPTPNL